MNKTEASNVIPFPVKAREPEWTHRWPKSLFPAGQHPCDAEPAPKLIRKRAAKRALTPAEQAKKALIRSLIWEISAMMEDSACPLRGDHA